MIPGSNLLSQALTRIAPTEIQWLQFTGRELNDVRQWVSSFADPVTILASVQAVPRSRYESLGLDFQKRYISIFALTNIADLTRNESGDRFIWGGRLYEVPSKTDWIPQDGWNEIIAVDVGAYVAPPEPEPTP